MRAHADIVTIAAPRTPGIDVDNGIAASAPVDGIKSFELLESTDIVRSQTARLHGTGEDHVKGRVFLAIWRPGDSSGHVLGAGRPINVGIQTTTIVHDVLYVVFH